VITSSGHVAFLGLLKGAVKSNSTAILAWVDGRLIKVIGSNDPAPGFPAGTFVSHDALNSFNNFAFSDAGMVIYGLVAPFAQAIWYWDFNETSLLAALKSEGNFGVGMVDEKAPFPLIGCDYYRVGMITPLSKLFINDKGDIIVDAIAISLDDTIDCPPLMTLNFKDSKAEIILQSNDQFPLNNGEFFNSLRTNHLNQAGGVNSLIGMGGTASAWYLSGDNELNLVALGGEYLPPDYTKSILPISGITPFAITSSSGRSVVSGIAVGGKYILAGSPRPSLPYSRIDQPENSHLDLIAKTNMHPPTFPETSFFSDLGEPIITNGGDIFFNAEIKSAVDNSSVHSIWRVKTDNSMQCILKTGQEIDVNGELMTLDRMYFGNSDSMQLKQFSDTGKFALRVRFVENWNDYIMVVGYK
jgi:hypothetical protein